MTGYGRQRCLLHNYQLPITPTLQMFYTLRLFC